MGEVKTVRECAELVSSPRYDCYKIRTDNPILDAIVIGCEECEGSGKRKDVWAGAVREVACPSCHGRGKSSVVDAETVEACATAACERAGYVWRTFTEKQKETWRNIALAVLEAAHINVADEMTNITS